MVYTYRGGPFEGLIICLEIPLTPILSCFQVHGDGDSHVLRGKPRCYLHKPDHKHHSSRLIPSLEAGARSDYRMAKVEECMIVGVIQAEVPTPCVKGEHRAECTHPYYKTSYKL